MRVFIKDTEYQGTPYEIFALLDLQKPKVQYEDTIPTEEDKPNFTEEDFTPLEELVNESKTLREKLTENPSYNPYGGVVPSAESEQDVDTTSTVTAEENTGVKLL